jgi:molybdenum cofactor cytidylyltransferase
MGHRLSKAAIHACVLAAGTSNRFGGTKLVQRLRGKPLVQHALLAAQGACKGCVTLVVGHDEEAVVAAAAGLSDNVVVNCEHQLGIGTSIAAGTRACRDSADAVLIMLADQPLVTTAHLNELKDNWSGADDEIVTSSFEGVVSPPILFPKKAFDALCELSGDTGAKKILSSNEFHVRSIDFPPAGMDIDTPEDLQQLDQD